MPQRDTQPKSVPDQEWTRSALLALILVTMLGVALGWASRGASLTVYGDDSIYLTLSRSLAEGHYRDEYLVGSPPHAQYPPGMPLWLLLVQLFVGGSLDGALAANLLLIALTASLLADSVRRLASAWLGVAAAAVLLFNPAIFALAGQLRSEIPFLAWCSLALWVSLLDGQRNRRWYPAFAIAAALAAFLTRSAGIALVPAIVWALLLRRQWRPLMVNGTAAVAVIAGWFAYTRWAAQRTVGHTYAADLASSAPMSEPVRFFGHALGNATVYFSRLAALQFNIPDIHGQPLDNLILGLLLTIPAAVGVWTLRRRWPAVGVFLLLSLAILLVFPWPVGRLLTVLLPWLVATLLIGSAAIAAAAGSRRGGSIALGIAVLLAGFGLAGQVDAAQREQRCRNSAPFVDPRCYQEQDRNYVAAASFIRNNLPKQAVIAASKPSIIYVLTGRRTLPLELFGTTRIDRLLPPAGPVDAILLSRLIPYEPAGVGPRLLEQCAALTLLAHFPSGTLLLGPRPTGGESPGDACDALRRYLLETPANVDDDPR